MAEQDTQRSEFSPLADPARPTESADLSALKGLVLEAFSKAAQQRRTEWYRMHGTVLKNRLLDLTGRAFSEADFGKRKFIDVVQLLDDVVSVDLTVRPFIVELLEPHRSQVGSSVASAVERWIRPDLWRAIVDYSSDGTWLWRPSKGTVINSEERARDDDGLPLPTLDPALLETWRAEFASACRADLDDAERRQIEEWSVNGLRASALPKRLVANWNALVRTRVEQRLVEFFDEHQLAPPSDLVNWTEPQRPANELRSFVSRCIGIMSDSELRELQIPAHVAMRVRR
ncbi:hypothetical protein [Candidatus Poriferisodalis sp.]|uniref:hypothetical protein n=1 Tax=Candidatus Poriferisodalis sp. TaxID=3101277 RepID=UPI003B51C41A